MMILLCVSAFNEAKIRHNDADYFLNLVIPFAFAELLMKHFRLIKTDALKYIGCFDHLHFDVYLFAGFGHNANVDDAEFVLRKLRLKMRVQKHNIELIVGQSEDRPQKTFKQFFVALLAEDNFEKKVVFGKEYLHPIRCFDKSHKLIITDFRKNASASRVLFLTIHLLRRKAFTTCASEERNALA
jgi:hypothetical protein